MTTLVLDGSRHDILLSHLALYGLAAIVEEAGTCGGVRVRWTRGMNPRPSLDVAGLDEEAVATALKAHARHHTEPTSLAQQAHAPDLSPRQARFADRDAWGDYQLQRQAVLQRLTDSRRLLDLRLLLGLGEPAHWRAEHRSGNQDEGASVLELTPRNRGSTFFGTRLSKLPSLVDASPEDVLVRRLRGQETRDELAAKKDEKFSATGLGPIGETDNVLVWCALWGLAWLPVASSSRGRAQTSAVSVDRNRHTTVVLPVWHDPWTPARCRSVLAARQLLLAGSRGADGDSQAAAAEDWVAARGARGVVTFAIRDIGTGKAALHLAQPGTVRRLASPR